MLSVLTILFVFFASVYGITSIYTKILLKKEGYNITYFYVELSDYRNLWKLMKEKNKHKLLFISFVSSTFFLIIIFSLIILSTN